MSTLLGEARVRIRPDTSGFEKDARSGVSRAASSLGAIAKKAVMAGGVVAAGAGAIGLKVAAQMETAEIGFSTMLGSGKKAEQFLGKLSNFAAKTPFEFPELQSAASSLVSVGVEADRVIPIMSVLGDATSAMGTGSEGVKRATMALQQMAIKGKVSGEEMLQLAEAGIPAWDALAASLGVSTAEAQKMVSEGKVSVDDLYTAIEDRAGKNLKRTKGMMDAQSKTLTGIWSTVKDTVQIRLAEAMKPIIPFIKEGLKAAVPIIDGALGAVSSGLTTAVSFLSEDVLPKLKSWGGDAKKALSDVFSGDGKGGPFSGLKKAATTAGKDIIKNFKKGVDTGDWGPFGKSIGSAISTAVSNIGDLALDFSASITDSLGKINWPELGMTIGKQSVGFILGFAVGLLNFDITPIFKFLADNWFEVLLAVIGIVFMPAKLMAKITGALRKIPIVGKFLAWILEGIQGVGRKVFGWINTYIIKPFTKGFKAGGPTLGSKFAGALQHVWTAAYVWADDLVLWFKNLPGRLSGWIAKYSETAGMKLRAFLKKAGRIFTRLGKAAWKWIKKAGPPALKAMGKFIGGLIKWLVTKGIPRLAKTMWKGGKVLVTWIAKRASGALRAIGKFIGRLLKWLVTKGIPRLAKTMARLGVKLISWIMPRVGKLLGNIGKFIGRLLKWVVTKGIPRLAKTMARLGVKLISWIMPRVGKLLGNIGKFTGRLLKWITTKGIPRLAKAMTSLGVKLVTWILPRVGKMLRNISEFLGELTGWIFKKGIPRLAKAMVKLGKKGVEKLKSGLKSIDLKKVGTQMLEGLGKGLTALKDKAKAWAKTIKSKIVGAVKDLFDIHSPSRVMEELGGHMVTGLLRGLSNGKGAIKKIVKATFGDPIEFLKSHRDKLGGLAKIPGFAEAAIQKVPGLLSSGAGWVKDFFGSMGGGGGGGTGQWKKVVQTALRLVGQPLSLTDTTLRRMMQESGGNAKAINLWDINAKRGMASRGLMQVIPPTFAAYRHKGLPNDIWNPLSNIVASMRYALDRYGSLSSAYNRPGGYDSGGLAPGVGFLPKYTIKPERVLSPSQTKAFEEWMRGEHSAQRSLVGGDLVIQSKDDAREDLAEALFQLRRIQRGGRYA